ncbi:MAG TPA: zinc dependent phospholipase C family protein [Oscillospiraceae bacterium]|nr:zinc dependent phospholipase C family protein [Oscillospiraceae bacterium]HPF56484.1 zinc dependent phospholipase C family protein [Clostridiales bacterium]HPK35105.1 zinc dependent phospholipase C family protein [Oscillospiraceae bacterium]HPR75256.1 zinc dependent phospholipase C family protein [Oscillospiraceae bacterium]
MLKQSHKLLGEYLIHNCAELPKKRHKKLFLWGCVEPDYNYLTYLKGSLKIQPFRGHHYPNGQSRILRLVRRLRRNHRRNVLNFYRLGKLMHYVADAFTYTHNPEFGGRVKGHHSYEINLHSRFQSGFCGTVFPLQNGKSGSAEALFFDAHQQYTETPAGFSTDLDYIVKVAASVFRLLVPEAQTAAKSRKLLLSSLYGLLRRDGQEGDIALEYSESPVVG